MTTDELARPSGTVTFLFTDIEDSTRRWELEPVAMQAALGDHDVLVRAELVDRGGYVFAATGDGFATAFDSPDSAVEAAVAVQGLLGAHGWPLFDGRLSVRMGLHTGTAVERDGNYFGPTVNLAARVMGVAAGGQVLVSGACEGLLNLTLLESELEPAGTIELDGIERPVELHVVVGSGLVSEIAEASVGPRRSVGDLPRYSMSFARPFHRCCLA